MRYSLSLYSIFLVFLSNKLCFRYCHFLAMFLFLVFIFTLLLSLVRLRSVREEIKQIVSLLLFSLCLLSPSPSRFHSLYFCVKFSSHLKVLFGGSRHLACAPIRWLLAPHSFIAMCMLSRFCFCFISFVFIFVYFVLFTHFSFILCVFFSSLHLRVFGCALLIMLSLFPNKNHFLTSTIPLQFYTNNKF